MFRSRSYLKEEMDTYRAQGVFLSDSLRKLSLINKVLGNTSVTVNAVKEVLNEDPEKIAHIIDLGCGAGDNLRAIGAWCFENNREVKLTGIDDNNHILMYANQQKSEVKIRYKKDDILNDKFKLEPCDILISSHFLYRFTDQKLIHFINRITKQVNSSLIFSELQRHVIPYYLFMLLGRIFFFNKMVRIDGLKAIKNSFKKVELRNILRELNIKSSSLKWKWAFRYQIIIKL